MNKHIRLLCIARNPAGLLAEVLEVRELLGRPVGGSRPIGAYWTGRTFKNDRAAQIEQTRLCTTITRGSAGHPEAWKLDTNTLEAVQS